jgi:hypothetical protein
VSISVGSDDYLVKPALRIEKRERMATPISVNLSVRDLKESIAVFTVLGFTFDRRLQNES